MQFLSKRIKHVIYVVKENRTFDQILGDLTNGANGDPSADAVRPGAHAEPSPPGHQLRHARQLHEPRRRQHGRLVLVDAGPRHQHRNDHAADQLRRRSTAVCRTSPRARTATSPVNFATVAERDAAAGVAGTTNYSAASAALPGGTANLLTGTGNHASADAPFGIEDGYIFNAVLKAGGTVRNYGFLVNNIGSIGTKAAPVSDPFAPGSFRSRRSTRRWRRSPTSTSAATTRTIRTCGATTSGSASSTSSSPTATCRACRWFASATTTWAASAARSAA